jgi:uncharacterized protein YneF (UPF0154 family)
MNDETDLLRVLSQHQIILFLVGAFLLLGLMLTVGVIIGRFAERRKIRNSEKDRNEQGY